MLTKGQFFIVGVLLPTGALLAASVGCSSTSSTGSSGTGGTTASSSSSSGSGTGGTPASTSSSSGGDAGVPTCAAYCAELATNCTGANQQFIDTAHCMATCASYPVGSITDMGGQDTLGCRQYHAGKNSMLNPIVHCPHAGPSGGDNEPSNDVLGDAGADPTLGVCGEGCEAFCNLVMTACTGANQQYGGSFDACFATCKTFPPYPSDAGGFAYYNDSYTAAQGVSGNFLCRTYHATAASVTPVPHCMHTNPANFDGGAGDPCF